MGGEGTKEGQLAENQELERLILKIQKIGNKDGE